MKIFTITTGNTKYIEIQKRTLDKYCKNDFELIVVNACVNKPDFSNFYNTENVVNNVISKCEELNLQFINYLNDNNNQEYYNSLYVSIRHVFILDKLLIYMKEKPDKYFILDSDMFLIKDLDFNKYKNSAIVKQTRSDIINTIIYCWPGLFYIDINNVPNLNLLNSFSDGSINNLNLDTGGLSYRWVMTNINNDYDYYYINHLCSLNWDENDYSKNLPLNILNFCKEDLRNKDNKYFCEIYDDSFLHIRAGSGWLGEPKEIHENLTNKLYDILMNI